MLINTSTCYQVVVTVGEIVGNRLLFIVFFLLLSYWGELIEIIALGSFTLETYWININLAIYFVTKEAFPPERFSLFILLLLVFEVDGMDCCMI